MKKVLLNDIHENLGARFTSFSGYRLPLYYHSITEEHLVVRNNVGVFDVSHMGRLIVEGADSSEFLNFVTANDVEKLYEGKLQYSLILNDKGGIKDDITIFMLSNEKHLLVVNAANRFKIINWLNRIISQRGYGIKVRDETEKTIMLAIQGPKSTDIVSSIFYQYDINLKRFHFIKLSNYNDYGHLIISRSGYTGEDGFELILYYVNKKKAINFWKHIYNSIKQFGGLACGLGARDMLRLEAGYCLYGNDIDESINPYEASLGWVVKLYKKDFIGKRQLLKIKDKIKRIRTGLKMVDPGIPRRTYKLVSLKNTDSIVGYVTSGGYSPILKKGIGMVYVVKDYIGQERNILIDIRGKLRKGVLSNFPLYDPNKYGYTRKKS